MDFWKILETVIVERNAYFSYLSSIVCILSVLFSIYVEKISVKKKKKVNATLAPLIS